MASIFWDVEGVLLVDYPDKGHTITEAYYADLLRQLGEKNQVDSAWKANTRSDLPSGQLKSTVALAAIQKCGFQLVEHPPYSPDLASSDYYLFPKM